jgi:hypothetical protein
MLSGFASARQGLDRGAFAMNQSVGRRDDVASPERDSVTRSHVLPYPREHECGSRPARRDAAEIRHKRARRPPLTDRPDRRYGR